MRSGRKSRISARTPSPSSHQILVHPRTALAEYIRGESEKKDKQPEADSSTANDEREDVAYFGEIAHRQLPRGASVAAVAPDGSALLAGHQGRDERMYS